jgi:hypothetical protein
MLENGRKIGIWKVEKTHAKNGIAYVDTFWNCFLSLLLFQLSGIRLCFDGTWRRQEREMVGTKGSCEDVETLLWQRSSEYEAANDIKKESFQSFVLIAKDYRTYYINPKS